MTGPIPQTRRTDVDLRWQDAFASGPSMSLALAPAVSVRFPPRRVGRWLAIGVLSLLVHLTMLDLLPRWAADPPDDESSDRPIHVKLMPAVVPVEAPPPTVQPLPTPTPTPTPHSVDMQPRPRPPRSVPPTFVPESVEPVQQVRVGPPSDTPEVHDPSPVVTPPASNTTAVAAPETAPAPVSPAPSPPTVAPQSARLRYKVVYVDTKNFNTVRYYGTGTIDWSTAEGRYRTGLLAVVDFLLFKVNVLESHSEGGIAPSGLVPDRYTESPRKRATVATNFNRDARQSISFSASPTTVPLVAGAQDRLSVLFQIGALLLADPQQSSTGGRIAIPVAGVRGDVESWLFETLGVETIDAAGATLETIHLRYVPRPGSNDRTIDVWTVSRDGYPARVLYTEPNGNTTEMTLDAISAADP